MSPNTKEIKDESLSDDVRGEAAKAALVAERSEKPEHPLTQNTLLGSIIGSPHNILCPGCGYGAIAFAITRVLTELDMPVKNFPIVTGIGCYTGLPTILPPRQAINALHGRALPLATGIKLSAPHMKPIVLTGDGDCLAIGGAHFINTCRRNLDAVVIMLHNNVYGMTGGQLAPTMKKGEKATTAPYGFQEESFNAVDIAIASGATHVARWTSVHIREFQRTLKKAIAHKGLSFIEMISTCPTNYGRRNGLPTPLDTFRWVRDSSVSIKDAEKLSDEEKENKFVIGEFKDVQRPELSENYQHLIRTARGENV
ncbi:MAG: 2-oxoacid:ferredoxin oxidoreductase subunit beta [bacterium]|nr:2-oxoacid:ferredoxin oxidoreductase subunit beta [bacterium]